jgi:hypothetical protein
MSASQESSGSTVVDKEVFFQRLGWIKYPHDSGPNKNDLLWPCLRFENIEEVNHLGDQPCFQHAAFQNVMATKLFAILMDEERDPGAICRLLGFEGGDYMDVNGETVHPWFKTLGLATRPIKLQDEYFDMTSKEEQDLYETWIAACKEAQELCGEWSRTYNKKRSKPYSNNKNKRQKTDNINGGGGSGGDDGGDDMPDSKPAAVTKAPAAIPAPVQRNPLEPATHHNAAPSEESQPDIAEEEEAKPSAQELSKDNEAEEKESSQETAPMEEEANAPEAVEEEVTETPVAAAVSSPQKVAAAAATAEPTEEADPPGTPPFNQPDFFVEPNEPWANVWNKMAYAGWNRRATGNSNDLFYTKPGKSVRGGIEGQDYFRSEATVQRYIKDKFPEWQQPVFIEPAAPAPQEAPSPQQQERRHFSSSATVITAESLSPELKKKPAEPAKRTRRRPTKHYNNPVSLSRPAEDRLFWRTNPIPTLRDVQAILLKLGVRKDPEDKCFRVPAAVNVQPVQYIVNADNEMTPMSPLFSTPTLHNEDDVRKFLCTRGIPEVEGLNLLDAQEKELLHQWVSFAYVPLDVLGDDWTGLILPKPEKLQYLLQQYRFENCDQKYYPPLVDHSAVPRDLRVEGFHFFRGLGELRDYIRRTKSLSWTTDFLEQIENNPTPSFNEAILRLWAASSPSPLPTYETSLEEIEHLDSMYPHADHELVSDDGEESDEESEAVETVEEPEMEEGEQDVSSVEASDAEDAVFSDSSESEFEDDKSSSEEDSPPPSPSKNSSGADGKRQMSTNSARELPWYMKKPVPSFDNVKPILKKMDIKQDEDGVWVLPGKNRDESLISAKSLREYLCKHGYPKFDSRDPRKPNLSPKQKEDFRHWISYANVPVTPENSIEIFNSEVFQAESKKLSRENGILALLYSLGFQRDADSRGYFPPGIDALGRNREVRTKNLLKTLTDVRRHVRCDKNLTLDEKRAEEYLSDVDEDRLLLLRWWGAEEAAAEPGALFSYDVPLQTSTSRAGASKKPSTSKKQEPASIKRQKPILQYPSWWSGCSIEELCKMISDEEKKEEEREKAIKEGLRVPRRSAESRVGLENLRRALSARNYLEDMIQASKEDPEEVIDDFVADISEATKHSNEQIQNFLCADKNELVVCHILSEIGTTIAAKIGMESSTKKDEHDVFEFHDDDHCNEGKKRTKRIAHKSQDGISSKVQNLERPTEAEERQPRRAKARTKSTLKSLVDEDDHISQVKKPERPMEAAGAIATQPTPQSRDVSVGIESLPATGQEVSESVGAKDSNSRASNHLVTAAVDNKHLSETNVAASVDETIESIHQGNDKDSGVAPSLEIYEEAASKSDGAVLPVTNKPEVAAPEEPKGDDPADQQKHCIPMRTEVDAIQKKKDLVVTSAVVDQEPPTDGQKASTPVELEGEDPKAATEDKKVVATPVESKEDGQQEGEDQMAAIGVVEDECKGAKQDTMESTIDGKETEALTLESLREVKGKRAVGNTKEGLLDEPHKGSVLAMGAAIYLEEETRAVNLKAETRDVGSVDQAATTMVQDILELDDGSGYDDSHHDISNSTFISFAGPTSPIDTGIGRAQENVLDFSQVDENHSSSRPESRRVTDYHSSDQFFLTQEDSQDF